MNAANQQQDEDARRVASLWEDAGPWLGASMSEHADGLLAVLEVADLQIAGSPIGARLRDAQMPRSPEAEDTWLRLVREHRERRRSPGSPGA